MTWTGKEPETLTAAASKKNACIARDIADIAKDIAVYISRQPSNLWRNLSPYALLRVLGPCTIFKCDFFHGLQI